MKDSTKLFISSIILVIAGFMKGIAPTVLNQPFDSVAFLSIFIIAIIVLILGIIKHIRKK